MLITFYNYSDVSNELNKVENNMLTEVGKLSGAFKVDTDINNPSILVKNVPTKPYNMLSFDFEGITYYYFINNKIIHKDCIELICHCDVLQTFCDQIKKTSGTVERASYPRNSMYKGKPYRFWNTEIEDNEILTTARTQNKIFQASGGALYPKNQYNYYLTTTN